jgi:hypothetical protein
MLPRSVGDRGTPTLKIYTFSSDHVTSFKQEGGCATTHRERIELFATPSGKQDAVLVPLTQRRVEWVLLEHRGVHVRCENEGVHVTVITFFHEAIGQFSRSETN